jgi:hypothetical protein
MPEMAMTVYRAFYGAGESRLGILRALFFEISSLAPETADAAQDIIKTIAGGLAMYLMEHMQSGRLRQMHPVLALQSFVGPIFFHLLTRPVAERLLGFDIDGEHAVKLLAENWLRAMAPEGRKP